MTETTPIPGSTPEAVAEQKTAATEATEPKPTYVKLAMRNMVRKGAKSLWHFTLTITGLLGFFVAIAYLTR